MDTGNSPHPLMAGVPIDGTNPGNPQLPPREGTLTGLATRDADGSPVLVSHAHVIAPSIPPSPLDPTRQVYVLGDEEMTQPNYLSGQSRKVGDLVEWARESDPMIDIGICDLEPGINASFDVHSTDHDLGVVVQGIKEPEVGMDLMVVGRSGGVGITTVKRIDDISPYEGITGRSVIILSVDQRPDTGRGDSGAPCLFEETSGVFKMCGVFLAANRLDRPTEAAAMQASYVESRFGIPFGQFSPIYGTPDREDRPMKMPVLTESGFVGRRLMNDSFKAGQDLSAGDVVGVKEDSGEARLFRIAPGIGPQRLVGVVHTPDGKVIGDRMADAGEPVPLVVRGVAKVLSATQVGVGDPLTPDWSAFTPPRKHLVARVRGAKTDVDLSWNFDHPFCCQKSLNSFFSSSSSMALAGMTAWNGRNLPKNMF